MTNYSVTLESPRKAFACKQVASSHTEAARLAHARYADFPAEIVTVESADPEYVCTEHDPSADYAIVWSNVN